MLLAAFGLGAAIGGLGAKAAKGGLDAHRSATKDLNRGPFEAPKHHHNNSNLKKYRNGGKTR